MRAEVSAERSAARARIYRLMARLFRSPDAPVVEALRQQDIPALRDSLVSLGASRELLEPAERLGEALACASVEELAREYEQSFEPFGGQSLPPNETAHAPSTPQESLTRTFELADIAGFYRAFGVEMMPGGERADHIAAELEFMHLLAVKEGLADTGGQSENAAICRDASASFLRDHLGRWCPDFGAQLARDGHGEVYRAAGALLSRFVELDLASASSGASAQ